MANKILNWLSNLSLRGLIVLAGSSAVVMLAVLYGVVSTLNAESEDENQEVEKVPAIEMSEVVVAKVHVPTGILLKESMLQLKKIPKDLIPEGAITQLNEVLNKSVAVELFEGDVLTEKKLYKEGEKTGFVGTIPPNCRAVSVGINDVTGVAGFAKPGDYVDVILVEHDDSKVTSSILLQNVLLLSINGDMGVQQPTSDDEVDPSTKAISNPAIATLALHPESVLRLVSATKLGEIYLVLRPQKPSNKYVDIENFTIRTEKVQEVQEQPEPPKEEKQPEPVSEDEKNSEPTPPETFEIIYGDLPPTPKNEK